MRASCRTIRRSGSTTRSSSRESRGWRPPGSRRRPRPTSSSASSKTSSERTSRSATDRFAIGRTGALAIERAGPATGTAVPDFARAQLRRQRANFALFLGPALLLLACFFIAPAIVDLVLAFTDMDRTLAITTLTLDNFSRMATRDTRLLAALGTTAIFVLSTLAIFNVTFALLLALVTTAIPRGLGAFFRAVWLLPRMSPSVVYALLWLWVIDPNERGLLNQIVVHVFGAPPIDLRNNHPLMVIILANGFIGASLGMLIFTSAIRSIPEHLFHAARADGAGALAIVRHIVFPALRWPISYMTI